MAILVTGGAGFIGSHTCVELLKSGYEIIILDNFSNSKPECLVRIRDIAGKDFNFYEADILDRDLIDTIFLENSIEAVIHFAGLKSVGESVNIPLSYYQNNIAGTIILCEVMRKYGVKNLVFSSSATVYGTSNSVPFSENTPLNVTNPYGRTKLMVEDMLRDLYESDNSWSIALLRYFNPIGAHESGKIGEDPNDIPNNLMPYITQVAIGKLNQLQIFGNDYSTIDGTGVRDYIHVMDLATGHIKALEEVMNSSGVEAYNLGTGIGYSVFEVVSTFETVTGINIPYKIINRRHGDVAVCYADPTKAKERLGWESKRGIEEMCRDSWRWQEKNPSGYLNKSLVQSLND